MELLGTILVVAVIGLVWKLSRLTARVEKLERPLREREKGDLPSPYPFSTESAKHSFPSPVQESAELVTPLTPPPIPPIIIPPPILPKMSEVAAPALSRTPTPPSSATAPPLSSINWERFFGVKLFAWVGGFALFLGMAFFVKYSFERGWISPTLRVLCGLATGSGLIVIAHLLPRQRQAVTIQALGASGVLVLYASFFAAHVFYNLIGVALAFAALIAVTSGAFVLAVRWRAPAVAVLGLAGGFLTPPLLSTGVDHAIGLFSYIALLDLGLVSLALRQRWPYLTLLGAVGTVLTQAGWTIKFFADDKFYLACAIFLGFTVLFAAVVGLAARRRLLDHWAAIALFIIAAGAFSFVLYSLTSADSFNSGRTWTLFAFIFATDAALLAVAWLKLELRPVIPVTGLVVTALLLVWIFRFLTLELLWPVLAAAFVLSIFHGAWPAVLQYLRPAQATPTFAHAAPLVALGLLMIIVWKVPNFFIWPIALVIDALAILAATILASGLAILAVLLLSALLAVIWFLRLPADTADLNGILLVAAGFGAFFIGAALFAHGKLLGRGEGARAGSALSQQISQQLAAMAVIMPMLLLCLVVLRLRLPNPSAVFGVALVLGLVFLGIGRFIPIDLVSLGAVYGVILALEHTWFIDEFNTS